MPENSEDSDIVETTNLSASELDTRISRCVTNLKIIGRIKALNKLIYKDGIFYIDEPTLSQGIRRWWNSVSRKDTINDLDNFITELFNVIDLIYTKECDNGDELNSYYAQITQPNVFRIENSNLLVQFTSEIVNALNGLNNLKQTYKTDISTISSLEIIIEKMNVRSKKITNILTVSSK
tara:strand:+ start:4152 stop:4688 length:537 start_codon:yes stop_codon:yes gene_type:complete